MTGIHILALDHAGHDIYTAIPQFVLSGLFALSALLIYRNKRKLWLDMAVVYGYLGVIVYSLLNVGITSSVVNWCYSIPIVSFFILSRRQGYLVTLGMFALMASLALEHNIFIAETSWHFGLINLLSPYCIIVGVVAAYEKVRKRHEWELTEFALTDPLTRCYNRLALKSIFSSFQQTGQDYSIMLLDIDHFKLVNDNHGHEAGDHVLTEFTNLFVSELGLEQVFRIGGEEFLLILEGTDEESLVRAESLRAKVQKHDFFYNNDRVFLTISAGLVRGIAEKELSELLKSADALLFQAKVDGRNRVVY